MTDPTLGIWIADDGTVGAPDPTNLYRFVGDNPVNEVDPSGLESISWRFKAQINYDKSFTTEERFMIRKAVEEAADRLEKAKLALQFHWTTISAGTMLHGKLFISPRIKMLQQEYEEGVYDTCGGYYSWSYTGKQEYLKLLTKAVNELTNPDNTLTFVADRSEASAKKREAWVRFYLNGGRPLYQPGKDIHITNSFFTVDPTRRADDIRHELGRRLGFYDENTGYLLGDVYEWDITIDALVEHWKEIIRKENNKKP